MNRTQALETATWLSDNFREYLKDGERTTLEERSSYWNKNEDVLHASAVSKCPKKSAAKRTGRIDDIFDDFALLRMEQGNGMGRILAQYAYWLQNKQNEAAAKDRSTPLLYADHEHSLYDSVHHVAGSADVMMRMLTGLQWENFPVEVKLTDAWKYGGLTLDQFAQCCMYIRTKRQERYSGNCNVGYVFTVYDKREAPTPWKVWTVCYDEQMDGYLLLADGELKQMNGFPSNGSYTFLPDATLVRWTTDHHQWMRWFKDEPHPEDLAAPLDAPTHWECASIVQPDYRKTAWTDPATGEKYPAGSLKKNTGTVTIFCPLFKFCWKDWLVAWGQDPNAELPRKFEMKIERVDL